MTIQRRRVVVIFAFLFAWAAVVVARLAQVQLVRNEHYTNRALRQQERTLALNPVRGSILDRRGRVLAESVAAESIYAEPQAIADRRATARALARVPGLRLNAAQIEARLESDSPFVWIARQVPLEIAAEVRRLRLQGVDFIEEHRRAYPRGSLAANVIGYVGVDGTGLAGIEHSLDAHVRGRAGKVTVLKDARRGMYLVGGEGQNRPVDGNDVVLTIDAVVQFVAEKALARAVAQYRAAGGAAMVMDARDGSILAMASLPTFDPNRYGEFPQTWWRNRNVQDIYEPGSTFKVVAAAAGLEEGVVTPSQILDCGDGAIRVANIEIREHSGKRFGFMPFTEVIAQSSNVGIIRVALALGEHRLYDYIRRFGFGERTGIDLPGEAIGLLRHTRRWSQVSSASIAIGQEIAATPLQVLRAVSAIANGGVRMEPRIVDRVAGAEGETIHVPPRAEPVRVISERTAAVLNEMLKGAVAHGTARPAALAEHIVAGKTGTAQKAVRGGYSPDRFLASFAGYVPADRPRLVIFVAVDEPRGEQFGGKIAAPVFREIAEATLRYLGVPPTVPQRSIAIDGLSLAAFSQRPAPADRAAVPDLRGLDARAAVAAATASGLLVEAIGSGVVKSQQPWPGEALPENGRIALVLAEARR
ncbi:MAG TPA: penicillin-binding transpeptidase domain-containing protein [Thermoanaerobaculia bacterium]|nr:penicillin-binding transpeptidase domain-containing protein [Thermoanaerobaculia bacterium]